MNNKPYKLQPLIHAATLVEERLSAELAPFGIKPRQARVLNVLHLMGSASQVELAREFDHLSREHEHHGHTAGSGWLYQTHRP